MSLLLFGLFSYLQYITNNTKNNNILNKINYENIYEYNNSTILFCENNNVIIDNEMIMDSHIFFTKCNKIETKNEIEIENEIKNEIRNKIRNKIKNQIQIQNKIRINYWNMFRNIFSTIYFILYNTLLICFYARKYSRNIIDELTTRIKYNNELDNCIICFDKFNLDSDIRKLKVCSHVYHELCIKEWIINYNKSTCPMCRKCLGCN